MRVNLTDIKPGWTSAGNPKVNFTVWLCDSKPDGSLWPRYGQEGWTLLRRSPKLDDRNVARTYIRLHQTPWVKWGDRFVGRYLTTAQIDTELLESIHQFLIGRPGIRLWMGLDRSKRKDTEVPEIAEDEVGFNG